MTLKQVGGDISDNLNVAGAKCLPATNAIYTCPAGKTAYVKEIVIYHTNATNSAVTVDIYRLPSGATDLTTTAASNDSAFRAGAESKVITPCVMNIARITFTVIARNTVLNAGDALKLWWYYGAVTPGVAHAYVSVTLDEF